MKKIVASVGLVAVGVAGAYAVAPGLSADTSKPWSLSGTLRGFYDDNYFTSSSNPRHTFGFEVSPRVAVVLPLDQTYFGASYLYRGRYYEDRGQFGDAWDHSHQFNLQMNHSFSERYSVGLQDSFVIAQEPDLLAPDFGFISGFHRTPGNNLRNSGGITFSSQLTRKLGLTLSYNNVLWDYEDDTITYPGGMFTPSRSGQLDRMEHSGAVELNWQALPETKALVGYNLGAVQFTGDQPIGVGPSGFIMSNARDNTSHYIYAGVKQDFLRNLTAGANLGARYIDYRNNSVSQDTWIPSADINVAYSYAKGSSVRVGFMHSFNPTDVIGLDATTGQVTASTESSLIYARLSHSITPRLVGRLDATYQDSTFQGGVYDGKADQFLMLGANLTYMINRHFSCEAGYNFDNLDSAIAGRPYDRNRVYLGVTASY